MKLFNIDVQAAKKLNLMLPKGYKLVTPDQLQKKRQQKPKKRPIFPKINQSQLTSLQQFPLNKSISKNKSMHETYDYNQGFDTKIKLTNVQTPFKAEKLKFPNLSEINKVNAPSLKKLPEVKLHSQTHSSTSINLNFLVNKEQKIEQRKPLKEYIPIQLPDPKNKCQQILGKLKNNPIAYQIINLEVQHQNVKMGFRDIYELASDQNVTLTTITNQMSKLFLKGYSIYPKNTESYTNTVQLEKYFKKLTDDLKKEQARMMAMYPPILQSQNSFTGKNQIGNKRGRVLGKTYSVSNDLGLTIRQKRVLGQSIKRLPSDALKGIIKIVYDTKDTKDNRQDYVVDLDNMATKKLRQLQTYVKNCCLNSFDQRNSQSKIDRDDDMSNEDQSFVIQDESG